MGGVTPLTLKPLPAAVMLVICTAAVPVLVSVMFCEVLLPIVTVPKPRVVGFATNCPVAAVVPVPLRAIVSGDPLALLATVMLPVTAPVTVGANFTASVAVCEAASVAGGVTPLTLKPVPAAVMLVICTVRGARIG